MSRVSETDRIERSVIIHAPRERVWRALSNAEEFGTWFGVNLTGQTFKPERSTRGPITYEGYEHLTWEATIERVEPPDLLSFRWHPYAIDPKVDYGNEEPTLVTFTLKDAPGSGTLLTVVESGFDKVPPGRRLDAFRMNSSGWSAQMENIVRHVASQA
ncbi:MAG TPA: SRPBCC family protein [Steroidobacteraceae bacterium]|nr:SRPBCC family protein [Steroidobacteraceae bacterium]